MSSIPSQRVLQPDNPAACCPLGARGPAEGRKRRDTYVGETKWEMGRDTGCSQNRVYDQACVVHAHTHINRMLFTHPDKCEILPCVSWGNPVCLSLHGGALSQTPGRLFLAKRQDTEIQASIFGGSAATPACTETLGESADIYAYELQFFGHIVYSHSFYPASIVLVCFHTHPLCSNRPPLFFPS